MKTLHIVILITMIGALSVLYIQNVYAISDPSPQDLYKQSNMVFYGQVISKQTGSEPDSYYYQVKVETYYKNPQTSDSLTVEGKTPGNMSSIYPQFEVGDKAIFYTEKERGMNILSPYSAKAGDGCDIHAFLGPAPIQGEPIARNPGIPLALLDANGSMVGSSLTNHPVFLTYDMVNNYPFSKNFTLEAFVEDQNDTSITFYKKQVLELGACEFTGDALKWSFVPTKSGTYSLNVNIDGQFRLGYGFQVIDAHSASSPNSQVVSSPLQQFKSGITADDIKCNRGLQLVVKAEDGSPACVKPDTASELVERGWGMLVPFAMQQNIPVLSSSITVPNANFTINYNISGNNKLLDANMDLQSKSLILSLQSTNNGTLIVSIPRALLDIKKNDRGMGEFYMLADGQETFFKEIHTTPTDRIFSIPFQNGTKSIEIIATELI